MNHDITLRIRPQEGDIADMSLEAGEGGMTRAIECALYAALSFAAQYAVEQGCDQRDYGNWVARVALKAWDNPPHIIARKTVDKSTQKQG